MTEPPSQHLEYAPAARTSRAARVRRWVLPAVLGLLIVGAIWIAPRLIAYATTLHRQRACLDYTAPATQVVLQTDAVEARKLLADPRYATDAKRSIAYFIPPIWTAYYTPLGGGFQTSGTVFLHEMTARDGTSCLVGVDVNLLPLLNTPQHCASLGARIILPGSAFRSPRLGMTMTRGDGSQIRFDPTSDRLTIFAGQIDPGDHSHFTVEYDLNGVRRTVDGWLVDGQSMKIESRD